MKIGVIGGNGVAATNMLCDMIEQKVTSLGAFRDAHHPEMIIWQATKAPSRSMYLEGRGPSWIPDYVSIAKQFRIIGCDLGCMCCNTAHYAIDRIINESGLHFLNLLELVAMEAKNTGERRFVMFCSDGARKFEIYRHAFERMFPEAELEYPPESDQEMLTKAICEIKSEHRFYSDEHPSQPRKILSTLVLRSKHPVIFGCTDLPVAFKSDKMPDGVIVDSLECLAREIVRLHKPEMFS